MAASQGKPRPRRELGVFDFTLLVIGATVGADVYIVAAIGASFLGPAQLVAWLAAGVLAALITLAFVQCAAICPRVGGSYAYTRAAFGPLIGFLAGWTLYAGEWIALPIFPIAFANYLTYFIPDLSSLGRFLAEALLIVAVTMVNFLGIRIGGRVNDVLTIAKLLPLGLLIVTGLTYVAVRTADAALQLSPFAPIGWGGFGSAVLIIFWAYAGFELAVLPAAEVRDPGRTLPLGLVFGMAITTIFYLLTSLATVVALPWQVAATSPRPLADAMGSILAGIGLPAVIGIALMSLGALVSIASVYEVFTLCLARLSYAMAADGLFPAVFARIHARFRTPYIGLAFQAVSALVIVPFFNLSNLIAIAVFFLGLCYLLTALAALRLIRRAPYRRLHVPALGFALVLGAVSSCYLSAQAPLPVIGLGFATIAAGAGIYALFKRHWQEAARARGRSRHHKRRLPRRVPVREVWLLQFLRRPKGAGSRRKRPS